MFVFPEYYYPISISFICLQEEMDVQVLKFQNKKLSEKLEEIKMEEESFKIQIEEFKKRERDNTELLSVIHRAWNQVDSMKNVSWKNDLVF